MAASHFFLLVLAVSGSTTTATTTTTTTQGEENFSVSPPGSLASATDGDLLTLLTAPRLGIRTLRIDAETPNSFRVSWQPVDPRNIQYYRLSYMAEGERREETVRTTQHRVCVWRRGTGRRWRQGVEEDKSRTV